LKKRALLALVPFYRNSSGKETKKWKPIPAIILQRAMAGESSADGRTRGKLAQREQYSVNSEHLFRPQNAKSALRPLELIQPSLGLFQPHLGQN